MGCDVIINGGDAFLDAYTAQNGDWRDVITGINQECVFTAIDWEADALTAASEEDHAYFTDYIERYGDQGAYIFLLEYAEDIDEKQTLRYDIKYYAEEHGYLYSPIRSIWTGNILGACYGEQQLAVTGFDDVDR